MLRQAFDRSRWAAPHIRNRIEADTRRTRAYARQRDDRARKEELDDKAEATASAMALAVALSPPATAQQIAAFEADLTIYDTATVDALMANQEALDVVTDRLSNMLSQAFVIEDGRRVFRTEDGTQVFDEFGIEIGADQLDPESIPDHHPTWEAFSAAANEQATLLQERQTLLDYQQHLDTAREAVAQGDITEAELEDLQAHLIETMPETVRTSLPNDHPAAQSEAALSTDTTQTPTTGPSLQGLEGFAPTMPTPGA